MVRAAVSLLALLLAGCPLSGPGKGQRPDTVRTCTRPDTTATRRCDDIKRDEIRDAMRRWPPPQPPPIPGGPK
jgi:hypothetical protein